MTTMSQVEIPDSAKQALIGAAHGDASVSSVTGKAFTQRPRRNSVPSVLEDLRHRGHGEGQAARSGDESSLRLALQVANLSLRIDPGA